ncbi:MAG: FkbM family methyltransferase [Planctomycetales bacterium]|nr:FkbM family methyltransferase [Planctomycetales bacterium]
MTNAACYRAFGRDFHIEPASAQHANSVFQDEYRIRELRQHDVRTIVDVGAHVGSFTVLCHEWWPEAKIVAVEPHPESFELLERNTAHISESQLLRINAAVTSFDGKCLLASAVSHSRVGEYVIEVWNELEPRFDGFGVEATAISVETLWERVQKFGVEHVDLLKLDCEGAEYGILEGLAATGRLADVGWIRGEWHGRVHRPRIAKALAETHVAHVDSNAPHECGLFVGHRMSS